MTTKPDAVVRVDDVIRLAKKVDDAERHWKQAKDDAADAKNVYETALTEMRNALRGRPLDDSK